MIIFIYASFYENAKSIDTRNLDESTEPKLEFYGCLLVIRMQ
jgi:hypothetical protein